MNEALKTRLARAVRGQSPQHSGGQILLARATTRDLDPLRGASSIVHKAAVSSGVKQIASLNTLRDDGTMGKAFCWGVTGFGWGQGEWNE